MKRRKFKLYRLKKTEEKIWKIDEKHRDIVLERIKIIRFFEKYGDDVTMGAFSIRAKNPVSDRVKPTIGIFL